MLHLVWDSRDVRTMCDKPLAEVGEEWTDDSLAICEEPDPTSDCMVCCDAAKKRWAKERRQMDREAQREGAMQAGMMGGIQAYNDYLGY